MRHLRRQSRSAELVAKHARQMRSNLNVSEAMLWSALQNASLGTHFRRQVVIANFIVDFLAPAARVIVEVDGGYHIARRAADARRDRKLARLGYRIVRLDVELVRQNLAQAVAQICSALAEPR